MTSVRLHTAIVAPCLVLCAACATSLPQQNLDAVSPTPDSWTALPQAELKTDARSLADLPWWHEFGDAALTSLIEEALQSNHSIAAAVSRLEAALAQATVAGVDAYPQLSAAGAGQRAKQNFPGFPLDLPNSDDTTSSGGGGILSNTSNSFAISLNVSWELDLWGRIRSARRAARADVEAGAAQLAAVELSIAGLTAKAWFATIEANQQLALAEETVDSYRTTAEQVRSRYERGVRSALDLRLALSEKARAEAGAEARREELDGTTRQLEILLGRYPAAAVASTGVLNRPLGRIPAGLPSELIARRPDLVAAERRLAASGARVVEARRALYPRLSLTGSSGTGSEELEDLVDSDFAEWSLAANLLQPIFQAGRLRAGVRGADARRDQALADFATAALGAYAEVESLLFAEEHMDGRIRHLREAAEQSSAARGLAEERYRGGLDGYITVLAAQRAALATRSTLIQARQQRLATRVDLFLALGGGFQRDTIIAGPASTPSGSQTATETRQVATATSHHGRKETP